MATPDTEMQAASFAFQAPSPNRELLQDCATALDDWTHTYAPELCDEAAVEAARQRILDEGGTLAYIGNLRQRIREALE